MERLDILWILCSDIFGCHVKWEFLSIMLRRRSTPNFACIVIVGSVKRPSGIKICRLDHISYISPIKTGDIWSRIYLSVSTTNLDNKSLLVPLHICFGLTDVVHRPWGVFAFVLNDEVYVLLTAFLEAGNTFVVEELVIILNILLLTHWSIFQYNLRIIERSLSHELAISQIHDFTSLWSILHAMLLLIKWANSSVIALLKEMECLLFLVGEILVCITLLQSRVRSYKISGSNFARRKLMSVLHLILDQEFNRQLFPLTKILRHWGFCNPTSGIKSCGVIVLFIAKLCSSLGRIKKLTVIFHGAPLLHHSE